MGDASKLAGVEASAISLLKRAVELDSSRRFDEAVTCYQEGLQLLLEVLKGNSLASWYFILTVSFSHLLVHSHSNKILPNEHQTVTDECC